MTEKTLNPAIAGSTSTVENKIEDDLFEQKLNLIKPKNESLFTGTRLLMAAGVIAAAFVIFNNAEVQNIWKWIKLQASEAITSGPTLASDAIGVFSKSFIDNTQKMGDLPKDKLIPLTFESITRFKSSPVRFKAEFSAIGKQHKMAGCSFVVEGTLDDIVGGVNADNYLTVASCKGRSPVLLEGYELVAFPPKINTLLAPVEYSLLELEEVSPQIAVSN